jgi:hypothetical protein
MVRTRASYLESLGFKSWPAILTYVFCGFPQSFDAHAGLISQTDRFHSHLFQFIIY